MKRTLCLTLVLSLFSGRANIIVQWTFNSPVPDGSPATGTLLPSTGTGLASIVGIPTDSFTGGDTATGHDPAGSSDNSGWRTTTYPGPVSYNKSAGVRFDGSTAGYESISVTWYQRNSSTASRYARLQYTLDGNSFTDADVIAITTDSVYLSQSANLSTIPGANNNPAFGVRIVTEFERTATGTGADAYLATKSGSTYSGAGAISFDMVTISGTPIPDGNTPPYIFCSIPNQTLRPNQQTAALPFTVVDAESSASNLVVQAACSNPVLIAPDNITLGGEGSDRTVTLEAGDQSGSATVTLWVIDPGGKSSSASFSVTVLPGNMAPTLSSLTPTNTLVNVPVYGLRFSVSDPETPAESLAVTAASANPALLPNDSQHLLLAGTGSNRTISLFPETGQLGVAPVTITTSDGTNVATSTFALMVVPTPSTLFCDSFDYYNGSVLTNSGFLWKNRSGTFGQCQATDGQLEVSAGQTEDVVAPLIGGPYPKGSGTVLYAAFKAKFLSLPAPKSGYFASFASGSTLRGRIYLGTSNAAPGCLRLSVANGTDANSTLPFDLQTNVTYTLVTRYVLEGPSTTLWLNPSTESDSGTVAADVVSASSIASYGFREDADLGANLLVDDLRVGLSFSDVIGNVAPPRLNIQRSGNFVTLTWSNASLTLQAAPSPGGLFTNVGGATSPFTTAPSGAARFFRLRSQ